MPPGPASNDPPKRSPSGMDPTPDGETRPVPDPTRITTQNLLREISWLRELMESRFASLDSAASSRVDGLSSAVGTRLDAMDRAVHLLQANADKSPTIAELSAQTAEKFRSIGVQFAERDTRTEQTSRDSKVAVDAALQAAKEAVSEQNKSSALAIGKSEASTTKQIDQIAILLQSAQKATDDKFSDMKERLTIVESRILGGDRIERKSGEGLGLAVGGIGLVVAVVAVVAAVLRGIR